MFTNKLFLLISKERFPDNSTHDSITALFEAAGKVVYVSLPKYSDSKNLKGFGFVEFDSDEGATQAVRKLNEWNLKTNPNGLRVMYK